MIKNKLKEIGCSAAFLILGIFIFPIFSLGQSIKSDPFLIQYNKVGKLSLGVFLKEVFWNYSQNRIGKVFVHVGSDIFSQYEILSPNQKEVLFYVEPDCRTGDSICIIKRIEIYNSKFHTPEKIKVGMLYQDITNSGLKISFLGWHRGNLIARTEKNPINFILSTSGIPKKWFSDMKPKMLPFNTQIIGIVLTGAAIEGYTFRQFDSLNFGRKFLDNDLIIAKTLQSNKSTVTMDKPLPVTTLPKQTGNPVNLQSSNSSLSNSEPPILPEKISELTAISTKSNNKLILPSNTKIPNSKNLSPSNKALAIIISDNSSRHNESSPSKTQNSPQLNFYKKGETADNFNHKVPGSEKKIESKVSDQDTLSGKVEIKPFPAHSNSRVNFVIASDNETIYTVSQRFNLSISEIFDYNPYLMIRNMKPGDKVFLVNKDSIPSLEAMGVDPYHTKGQVSKIYLKTKDYSYGDTPSPNNPSDSLNAKSRINTPFIKKK